METSQSPRAVLRAAYRLALKVLPDYACKRSRRDFTLAQLFAPEIVKPDPLKMMHRDEFTREVELEVPKQDDGEHTGLHKLVRRWIKDGYVTLSGECITIAEKQWDECSDGSFRKGWYFFRDACAKVKGDREARRAMKIAMGKIIGRAAPPVAKSNGVVSAASTGLKDTTSIADALTLCPSALPKPIGQLMRVGSHVIGFLLAGRAVLLGYPH